MSELYTTGEMAKLCGVTVRTVQYYDTRGISPPVRSARAAGDCTKMTTCAG
jgi:DNA-binding transcriptional MerR regulator